MARAAAAAADKSAPPVVPQSEQRALPNPAGHQDLPLAGFNGRIPEEGEPNSDSAYSTVYQSVAAAHENGGNGKEWTENSRLFYGPASQFAFLQQVHRGINSSSGSQHQQDREVEEGGAGLDLFLQRSFFFGTASRFDTQSCLRPANTIFPEISYEQAKVFMEAFKAWTAQIIPLFSNDELDRMLLNLYSAGDQAQSRPTQTRALTLAALAVGALTTPQTDVGEMLLHRAKYEAVLFDDTVSLQMVQFSLLLADYHTGMGRPNSVYLYLGTACRKAFALGLHRESATSLCRPENVQKFRTTLWSLYWLENWYSMTVGRESSLKMADISSPFPENQPLLVRTSQLAHIAEQVVRTIYTQRYDSLRKLYTAAEAIHAQLRVFAAQNGIGCANEGSSALSQNPASLMFHNLFYHTILLAFRPFLVADHALNAGLDGKGPSDGSDGTSAMWLRQACRTAIDSAQDCIIYAHAQIRKHEECRTSRYNGFFLESSCAVLFFDILRHPSKYPYNVEYINMALEALDMMINDEPVTNARRSIRQILRVAEEAISRKGVGPTATSGMLALTDPRLQPGPSPAMSSPASFLGPDQQPTPMSSARLPSLNEPHRQLIYYPDLGGDEAVGDSALPIQGLQEAAEAGGEWLDPLVHFHYDVLATDLYSFFPLNMTPPSATSNEAREPGDGAAPVC